MMGGLGTYRMVSCYCKTGYRTKEIATSNPANKDGNCPILANNSRVKYVQGRLSE